MDAGVRRLMAPRPHLLAMFRGTQLQVVALLEGAALQQPADAARQAGGVAPVHAIFLTGRGGGHDLHTFRVR